MKYDKSGRGYKTCNCEQARAEFEEVSKKTFLLADLNDKIELYENMLQREKDRAEKLLKESNLGRRFKGRTFETFNVNDKNKTAYNTCLNFADNFDKNDGNGIILAGSVGTGKTHLAGAIVHRVIEKFGIPVKLITAIELFGKLRDFENDTMKEFKESSLLVIDDLGKEKITDWNREKLFEIINSRYEDYQPTIITTNLKPKEMQDLFGDAVFSRLCEMCEGIALNGEDFRKK